MGAHRADVARLCPISIGSPKENPVTLVSSDWEDIYANNPGHVLNAAGAPRGGPWSIFVERDGDYEIMPVGEFRRNDMM